MPLAPAKLPGAAQRAWVIALLVAAWKLALLIYAVNFNVFPVAVLLLGAWGIRKGLVWAAYGLALYQALTLTQVAAIFALNDVELDSAIIIILGALLALALAFVFFRAGRSLEAAGAEPGRRGAWLTLSAVPVVVAVALFFVRAFVIPTGSMEDTLLIGDHILVRTYPRPEPIRDQVTVYRYPVNPDETFVKRIVGISGDRIRLEGGQLWRNGEPLEEPYAVHKTDYTDEYRDNFPSGPNRGVLPSALDMLSEHVVDGELVVPEGSVFVLGDNRHRALDSRYHGLVPEENLVGIPFLVYNSIDRDMVFDPDLEAPMPKVKRIRWERLFKPL